MALETVRLAPRIGTLIETNRDEMLGGAGADEIRALLDDRGVLAFRGAQLDDEEQLAFTRTIGAVYEDSIYKVTFDTNENPLADYNYGNFSWHIDRTDTDLPPRGSMLNARRLTVTGGQTEFANTYAAYEDLPDSDKELIDDLEVVHRVASSFRETVPSPTEEQLQRWAGHPDKIHPLVWHHRNGRNSLVTSTSGMEIVGWPKEEGAALLRRLMEWATRPEYVYRHEWEIGDLVLWDNTGTMHRVLPYDLTAGRQLHRTTLAGEEPVRSRAETADA